MTGLTAHREQEGVKRPAVVITGGGTGGHLFPGIAVARAFMDQFPGCRIRFISSGRAIEETILSDAGFDTIVIGAAGIKGKSWGRKIGAVFMIPVGLAQSIAVLLKFKPDVVIGLGGYSAGPVVVAAWLLGIPRVIQEQNLLPGVTNRILARLADLIFTSFPDTAIPAPAEKIRFTGNPVRREIIEAFAGVSSEQSGRFTVLVLGGSQGARGLNRLVVEALDHLKEADRFCFIHQTGSAEVLDVATAYAERDIENDTAAFFTDMASLYARADLVICRAGATTVAEIIAAGKAAIFIPFPHAADNHQVYNARGLVEAGAAEMVLEHEATGPALARKIVFYADHPDALREKRENLRPLRVTDAAERIVDHITRLVGSK